MLKKKRKNLVDESQNVVKFYKIDVLYYHVDDLQWWKENKRDFPLIAIMARVLLSRELTSCFQERVFSCAEFVGNNLGTSTLSNREEKSGWFESIKICIRFILACIKT